VDQFTKSSSGGWSSPWSAMVAVSFAKSGADGGVYGHRHRAGGHRGGVTEEHYVVIGG
jgi:hypothetical protein